MKLEPRNLKRGTAAFLLLFFPMFGTAAADYRLVCDEPVYDFGRVDQTAVITNVFTIRNEGVMTFPLKYIHASCGCTRGRMSTRMLEPGKTAEVTAIYKAARRSGPQKKALRLISTTSEYPALTLYLTGFVETP
jgi:hypothetical protein